MQRYNIFYQVHKGLRHMLYQTATKMQQTDFANAKESTAVLDDISEVLDLFDGHANTEDDFVIAPIIGFEPSAGNMFEEEHVQDHALSNRMRALINMFHHAVSSEERNEMASAIRLAFTEFLIFNLKHMAKEESYLNRLLWQHFTDEQLHAITLSILAHLPKEKMDKMNTLMMRALSNAEICAWLNATRKEAPDFVVDGLLLLAETELPATRWNSIKQHVTEDATVAA